MLVFGIGGVVCNSYKHYGVRIAPLSVEALSFGWGDGFAVTVAPCSGQVVQGDRSREGGILRSLDIMLHLLGLHQFAMPTGCAREWGRTENIKTEEQPSSVGLYILYRQLSHRDSGSQGC